MSESGRPLDDSRQSNDPGQSVSLVNEASANNRGPRAAAGRIFGLTFLPVWGSSGTLAACMFLPVCLLPSCQIQGCGTTTATPPTPLSPYELYKGSTSLSELIFVTAVFQWPFVLGLLVCSATLFIAATGQARHFRPIWFGLAGIIVVGSIGLWWHLGNEIRRQENRPAGDRFAETAIAVAPTILFCLALVATYFNCRTWLAAVAWLQLSFGVYGMAWFTLLDGVFPLLWGGRVAQAACLALALASFVERRRAFKTLGVHPP